MNKVDQLQKDIAFCIDKCGMNDEQIGEFLRASEELGIGCEYLAEEFIFQSITMDEFERLHCDSDYLNIAEFNALYWEN
tara:strand:- start:586 stop:822 length:237 start_codon:yes stop_codon:yes gene_type:complete